MIGWMLSCHLLWKLRSANLLESKDVAQSRQVSSLADPLATGDGSHVHYQPQMIYDATNEQHEAMAYRIAVYSQSLNLPGITLNRIPDFCILTGTASSRSRLVPGLYYIFISHLLFVSAPVRGETHAVTNEDNYLFLSSFKHNCSISLVLQIIS